MRKPKYISPTSYSTFNDDRTLYYLRYLAENRLPRDPQTRPMAVGSAFDAFIKAYLYKNLIGSKDPAFKFEALFEAQVEEQNRDWAMENGRLVFGAYLKSGAPADLMATMSKSIIEPRFEFIVYGVIEGQREGVDNNISVPIHGRPDLFFINETGAHVIYDWKVNGYCSKSGISPAPGYINIRDGFVLKPSRNVNQAHKNCVIGMRDGIAINTACSFEQVNDSWANQLTMYGWVLGEEVGTEIIIGIDQLACRKDSIRVAEHRSYVSEDYQYKLRDGLVEMWNCIETGYIFTDLTPEQSKARCNLLDQVMKQDDPFEFEE